MCYIIIYLKPNMLASSNFSALGLDNWILRNISCLEYTTPTIVQEKVIPKILKSSSTVAISRTGTGKTASFCLPLLHILSQDPFGLFAIILEPTRELAMQVLEKLKVYSTGFNLRVSLIIGGTDYTEQATELDKIPHIIIATPGRLKTLLMNDSVKLVCNLKFLVLDEFDQLLNDSIKPDIEDIIEYLPNDRKTLFFSATMSQNKEELNKYRGKEDKGDLFVFDFNNIIEEDSTKIVKDEDNNEEKTLINQMNKELEQKYILLNQKSKENYILYIMQNIFKKKIAMIFVSTYKQCNFLYHLFKLFDLRVSALHSKMPQKDRINNLTKFKSSYNNILIATDVASRGLDIPICDLVINYDLPRNPDDYIHRAGRTARAGKKGTCISFVTQYDVELILAIEDRINTKIEEMSIDEDKIMEDMSIVSQGVKLALMKIYESGFDEKVSQRKKNKNNGFNKRKEKDD